MEIKFGDKYIWHGGRKGYRPRSADEINTKDGEFAIKKLMTDLRDDALTVAGPLDDRSKRRLAQALDAASRALPEGW